MSGRTVENSLHASTPQRLSASDDTPFFNQALAEIGCEYGHLDAGQQHAVIARAQELKDEAARSTLTHSAARDASAAGDVTASDISGVISHENRSGEGEDSSLDFADAHLLSPEAAEGEGERPRQLHPLFAWVSDVVAFLRHLSWRPL
jgi:hypothetical protein